VMLQCQVKFCDFFIPLKYHVKNYEIMSVFVNVLPRIL